VHHAERKTTDHNGHQGAHGEADDCLALAKSHHLQAEKQHEGASRQLVNAGAQQDIAAVQHRNADRLEYKAEMLEALACSLKADAVKISEII
jgi:hypothetical protein